MHVCLFDIDGTLIRTGGAGMAAFAEALRSEFGIDNGCDPNSGTGTRSGSDSDSGSGSGTGVSPVSPSTTNGTGVSPVSLLEGIAVHGRTDRAIVRDIFRRFEIEDSPDNWRRFLAAYLKHLPQCLRSRTGEVLRGVVALLERLTGKPSPLTGEGGVGVREQPSPLMGEGRVGVPDRPRAPSPPTAALLHKGGGRREGALIHKGRGSPRFLLGLLTGNVREGARLKLTHYRLYHHFRFGGFGDRHDERDDVAREALTELRRHHNGSISPERIWVIGDTPSDIRCARTIGARAVAVATGMHTLDELAAERPDLLLPDLTDPALLFDAWRS